MKKTNNKILFSLVIVNILFTLFTYRSVFSGKLLGDPFDTRLQIILHEHWFRWINGRVSFRDTEFFYPFDKALGFSDVFLTQGIIYSFFRFLGIGLAKSWMSTTLLLLIVGNLSWVYISRKYIKSFILQLLLILTAVSSLSFVYYFSFNPNIVGYSFLPWFAILLISISKEQQTDKKYRKILIFITLLLIYSLSCWYGTFFLILLMIVKYILFQIFTPRRKIFYHKIELNRKLLGVMTFQLPIQLFLIWIFSYVYISVANQPSRPVEELLQFSPRIDLLPNGANFDGTKLSGAIFKNLYTVLHLDFDKEYGVGIGIFSIIFSIIILFLALSKKLINKNHKLWILSYLFVYLYFVGIFNNYSLHTFLFENVPGFNSIRFPGRYIIILGYFFIFSIYFVLDKLYQVSSNYWKKIAIVLVTVILLLDQIRSPYKGWNSNLMNNSDLNSQKLKIKAECDYFYYDFPGGWWYDQIEAMMFAVQIGVPTVNGYSGAYPKGYPSEDFRSDEDPLEIFNWISKIDSKERGCLILGSTGVKYLNKAADFVDFVGFEQPKGFNNNLWSTSPNPYIYFYSNSKKDKEITFTLRTSSCYKKQEISLVDGQYNELFPTRVVDMSSKFKFKLELKNSFVERIQVITRSQGCLMGDRNENVFFEIRDFEAKSI